MTKYEELNTLLQDLGLSAHETNGVAWTPIDILVNTNVSVNTYTKTLLEYLPVLKGNEQEMVVRALTEKGNKEAMPHFLKLLSKPTQLSDSCLWAIGNAIFVIDDSSSYPEIVALCSNEQIGMGRQMMLGTLAKVKTEKAYHVLIECLNDSSLKGHAIEALGKFGDTRAIDLLEKTEVDRGKYEYKAKQTAIKRLSKKKNKLANPS